MHTKKKKSYLRGRDEEARHSKHSENSIACYCCKFEIFYFKMTFRPLRPSSDHFFKPLEILPPAPLFHFLIYRSFLSLKRNRTCIQRVAEGSKNCPHQHKIIYNSCQVVLLNTAIFKTFNKITLLFFLLHRSVFFVLITMFLDFSLKYKWTWKFNLLNIHAI